MNFAFPFLVGAVLTVGFVAVSRIVGLHRERGVWTTTLISIALFYIVFAAENAEPSQILLQAAIASVFMGLALLGYMTSLWWVVAGLALHGIFDLVVWKDSPAPDWWGPLCLAADVLLALSLAVWLRNKAVAERPNLSN